MTTEQWLTAVLLGAVLGAAGQGIRAIVGLKKLQDDAVQSNVTKEELFHWNVLIVSLLIGAIAGTLASIGLGDKILKPTTEVLLGLVAAGYAGADFIEGFARKHLPAGSIATNARTAQETKPTETNAGTAGGQTDPATGGSAGVGAGALPTPKPA